MTSKEETEGAAEIASLERSAIRRVDGSNAVIGPIGTLTPRPRIDAAVSGTTARIAMT
jgi:hypothetical protein